MAREKAANIIPTMPMNNNFFRPALSTINMQTIVMITCTPPKLIDA
jgi:hypothetical protein